MKVAYIIAAVAGYKHGSQLIITQRSVSGSVTVLSEPNQIKKHTTFLFCVCVHNKLLKLHLTSAEVLAEFLLQLYLLGPIQTQHKCMSHQMQN